MSEPWTPEPPPRGPRYVARTLPLCPECKGLARRTILAMTNEGQQYGPWRCDIHGELARVEYEEMDVPTYDEDDVTGDIMRQEIRDLNRHAREDEIREEAYDLSDPKHPRHHEVHADAADLAD